MSTPEALIKANPLLPGEDYDGLRKKGFKDIEKMGNAIWTDYNNSDPGITMLEAVSYAITDLAYRTGFEVQDLLAPKQLSPEVWNEIFYTARKIFHNGALTINDYRKLIIDIEGVRNAWVEPSKDYEVPLWINYNHDHPIEENDCSCDDAYDKICMGKLQLNQATDNLKENDKAKTILEIEKSIEDITNLIEQIQDEINKISLEREGGNISEARKTELDKILEENQQKIHEYKRRLNQLDKEKKLITDFAVIESKIVELEGLYNVMVEYEENIIEDDARDEIRDKVQDKLYRHRNLGEDFLSINAVEYEDFGISASIRLEEYADSDEVLAQMYFIIYKYFTPSIPFYTIEQMLDKGMLIDEVFEGPALRHGFIDTDELEATSLYRDIRLSDIINEIVDIPGIIAMTFLKMPFSSIDDDIIDVTYFTKWVNKLKSERKIARIRPDMSLVYFCKEREFLSYNTDTNTDKRPERMLKLFRDLKILERKYKLSDAALDLPVPTGEHMELEDYYPISETLPMCYGIK